MDVTLIGAEFEENLAVRYLHGALEQSGHRVQTIVFNHASDTERCARQLARSDTRVAGLSMVFTYRAREFAALATRARELGYREHIVAGGHFAAFHASDLLRDVPAIDSVGCGEGEAILVELCDCLPELDRVAGLVWRRGDEIVRNSSALKPPDLDVLPFPPRKSPFDHYLGVPITNILSSRGCTHHCGFCSIAAWHRLCGGDRLRLRTPSAVADEMAMLHRQGVRIFNFHDDNFVLDDRGAMGERLSRLEAELDRRGVVRPIAFAIKCRPDVVEHELFEKLRAMGMFRVFLGVEAGTAVSLGRLGRGQSVQDNERALGVLNALDVHACFNLLLLNPDSTLEDFAENVAFLRRNARNPMNFCRTEVYAGTPLERRLRRAGRLLGDYWGYDYRIADPRAQLAFELVFAAFEGRNFAEEGLHHLTMHLDYEAQLLGHFFGPHRELRHEVKRLVLEVNHNTCQHLESVVAAVPTLGSSVAVEAFDGELRSAVTADDHLLGRHVRALLDEVERAATTPRPTRRGWRRAAATAGLAATVSLALSGCQDKSHTTEMAAPPTSSASGPPPRDAAADESPSDATGSDGGLAERIHPEVGKELLPLLKQKVVPRARVELEISVGGTGRVEHAALIKPVLPPDDEKAIVTRAESLTVSDPSARGQRVRLAFTPEEIEAAPSLPADRGPAASAPPIAPPAPTPTHVRESVPRPEMAPRPPPRPEMAPRPPKR